MSTSRGAAAQLLLCVSKDTHLDKHRAATWNHHTKETRAPPAASLAQQRESSLRIILQQLCFLKAVEAQQSSSMIICYSVLASCVSLEQPTGSRRGYPPRGHWNPWNRDSSSELSNNVPHIFQRYSKKSILSVTAP